jgi:hypothetical protein
MQNESLVLCAFGTGLAQILVKTIVLLVLALYRSVGSVKGTCGQSSMQEKSTLSSDLAP